VDDVPRLETHKVVTWTVDYPGPQISESHEEHGQNDEEHSEN